MTARMNSTLDALSRLPYFRGKGALALGVLKLSRDPEQYTALLPNGARVRLGLDTMRQTLLPYWIGKYEPQVIQVFMQALARLGPSADVIDIGANLGFYSVLAAQSLRQRGSGVVHSFEPNPRIFTELGHNVALNSFSNVRLQCAGVGDVTSEMTLYVNEHAVTYSSLRQTQEFLQEEIRVPIVTLDEYAETNKLSRVGLVKVDVEGGELLVFKGARTLLARDHPTLIYEEFERGYQLFGYSAREVRAYLTGLGYRLYAIPENAASDAPLHELSGDAGAGYQNILATTEPLK